MIPDWQANQVYLASTFPGRFPDLWERMTTLLQQHGIAPEFLEKTKDIWIRDFLPVQVDLKCFVAFRYDPDYLQGFQHLRSTQEVCQQIPELEGMTRSSIRLDGGNLVSATNAVIVTEKLFPENRERNREKLRQEMQTLLRVERLIVIPTEPGDVLGHADGVVRFLDDSRVVINTYTQVNPRYGTRLRKILQRAGLEIWEVPYRVEPTSSDGIGSAVGNYVNYLRLGPLVIVPAYGVAEDETARSILQELLPGASVVSLECADLARQGGVLNCCTWSFRSPQ